MLNIWHSSMSSTRPTEGRVFSAVKVGNGLPMEGFSDDSSSGIPDYMNFNWKLENVQDFKSDENEKLSDDVLDLLPSDPFGMDLATTFTAITGWLEDIESNFGLNSLGFVTDQGEVDVGEDRLLAELNLIWDGAVKVPEASFESGQELWAGLWDSSIISDGSTEDFRGFSYDECWVSTDAFDEFPGCSEIHVDNTDGTGDAPHDALFFALGYLGVMDLLSVERVCKSLRDAVQNDPLLWRNIHIDRPLSHKITDDALLQLSSRAQGTLQCLNLVGSWRITNSGLSDVLENNPGITKLSVPGCLRLTAQGILCILKAFKSSGKLRIKHLRVGGLSELTSKQFEELNSLLYDHNQTSAHKPQFYRGWHMYLSCDDDRAIDIEACPRCQKIRQVYDCPTESCQLKRQSARLCRACAFCIPRCLECGRCINGYDYEETFSLDLICLDCWKQQPLNCENVPGETGHSSKCTVFHQARYQFCLCG